MNVLTARKVHAIKINLQSMAERSVIVWPNDTAKLCVQLMNPRRTWFTVQRGDSVILNGNREFVNSVRVRLNEDAGYRCYSRIARNMQGG